MSQGESLHILDELREFASFTTAEQRYIRRSLEVAFERADAADHWARGVVEAATIGRQAGVYGSIERIRSLIPAGIDAGDAGGLMAELIPVSAFDLEQGKITSFAAYRFLYERLIGADVRPWLVSAFCGAAALPTIHPELRTELLRSLTREDVAAAGWSGHEPSFFPEWVEKVPLEAS